MAERTLKTIMTQTDDLKSRPNRLGPKTPAEKLRMLVFAAAQRVNCGINDHHLRSVRSCNANRVSSVFDESCMNAYLFRNRFSRSSFHTMLDEQLFEALSLGPRPQRLSRGRVLSLFIHFPGIAILFSTVRRAVLADIAFRLELSGANCLTRKVRSDPDLFFFVSQPLMALMVGT